jgi:hypothetical protein
MNPIMFITYRCPECEDLHSFEEDAKACCAPEAEQVCIWRCDECGHETDDEDMARYCCLPEDVELPATPQQLEAAGQQRLAL